MAKLYSIGTKMHEGYSFASSRLTTIEEDIAMASKQQSCTTAFRKGIRVRLRGDVTAELLIKQARFDESSSRKVLVPGWYAVVDHVDPEEKVFVHDNIDGHVWWFWPSMLCLVTPPPRKRWGHVK